MLRRAVFTQNFLAYNSKEETEKKNVHSCIIIFLFQGNVLIMYIVLLVLRSNNIIFYQFIGDIV